MVQSKIDMNLGAAVGVAVREFQTTSGPVDYGLFVDRRLCGVIEAKPEGATFSDFPSRRLATSQTSQRTSFAKKARSDLNMWPQVRKFCFVTTPILNLPLAGCSLFIAPRRCERWIKQPATLRARLQNLPQLSPEGLRGCQIEAVSALERSMAQNHPRALVQMATGAGKTFTACTLSYRILAHAGFRRILFLADRANLVRQARDEYLA